LWDNQKEMIVPTFAPVFLSRTPRRVLLAAVSVLVAAALTIGLVPPGAVGTAQAADPTKEEIMKAGDLPDIAVGKADAPVTIVEYASLTCSHCAEFHAETYEALKKKYIDTGKVRLIMRDFPLDNLAAAAAMLVRCQDPAKAPEVIKTLFAKRREWIVSGNPLPQLFAVVKPLGFTQEMFDKCITDQKVLDKIAAERARASQKFGVNSTPTFFIDGKKHPGALPLSDFDKIIEPLLKKS
jgi:protein-disulfide isomerase